MTLKSLHLLIKIEKRPSPMWLRATIPLLIILSTFGLTSLLIIAAEAKPGNVVYEMLIDPFTGRLSRLQILSRVTPLLLLSTSVAVAFRTGFINIGIEGQFYAGAIAAAWLGPNMKAYPHSLVLIAIVFGGGIFGALWALIPILLKFKFLVSEVISTLLLNFIMTLIISGLLNGPWRSPSTGWPQSPELPPNATFSLIFAKSQVHWGIGIAIFFILFYWWLITFTRLGLEMKATGQDIQASQYLGINTIRIISISALMSGGFAGIAGCIEVAGIHHHLVAGISSNYPLSSIVIANIGLLSPFFIMIYSFFFSALEVGALSASRTLDIPVYLADVIQSFLLLLTISIMLLNKYRLVIRDSL